MNPSTRVVRNSVTNVVSYGIIFALFLVGLIGLYQSGIKLTQLKAETVTVHDLPFALALSFFRMSASYVISLVFAFILGLIAALSRTGERVIIPFLDIMQSVPVVAFFPAAISFFINAVNGHRMGVEMAAVFLIFTSQAWNLAFAVFESVKTIPPDCLDATKSFGVNGSLKFLRLFAPSATPRLIYNSILSWSNGWFFLVACEIIAVGPIKYNLPGIGSFLAIAAQESKVELVVLGLIALMVLIITLDFLIWRPLSLWSERFRYDQSAGGDDAPAQADYPSWFNDVPVFFRPVRKKIKRILKYSIGPILGVIQRVLLFIALDLIPAVASAIVNSFIQILNEVGFFRRVEKIKASRFAQIFPQWGMILFGVAVGFPLGMKIWTWVKPPWPEITHGLPTALLASTLRLTIALVISTAWTVPLVIYCWNRPKLRQWLTTCAQIGASLPAIALFPFLILIFVRSMGASMEFATLILLLNGMQWYVLFNALSGAQLVPPDLADAVKSFGSSRSHVAKRLVLPTIAPALTTGLITAWGGGWNALVVSEYVANRDEVLTVHGIGSLVARAVYESGDTHTIIICTFAMIGWIILLNTVFWRPLLSRVTERYRLE